MFEKLLNNALTHNVEEYFHFCSKINSKIPKPITILFNNYVMTLQPNLPLGLWHDLIIYGPHSNSKMDNG
jgi:hypothetical protein